MNVVKLRKIEPDDKEPLATLANNKKIWDNVRDYMPYPYTLKDAEEFIDFCKKENPSMTFAIEYQSQFAGVIGLVKQTDIYRHSAEIGYWLGEPFWNKGIMTQAVRQLVDYGFQNIGLVRIYTGVFDYNKASQRVLEKAGFTLEAIFRKSVIKNEIIGDEYRYCLLKNTLIK
jgi:[ribosomal protein S5]-alanine N-acetyltransferase